MEKGDKKLSVFARATEEAQGFINLMETYLGETPYGFCFTGNDGTLLYVNNKVEEITGYSRDELIGKHVSELAFISPEVMRNILDVSAKNKAGESKPLIFEFEMVAKGGAQKWIAITVIPIKKAGTQDCLGNIVFVFDHSENRKIQEKLQFSDVALKSISEGIIIVDKNLCITDWNEACERIFEVQASEIIGKKLFEAIRVLYPTPDEIKRRHMHLFEGGIQDNARQDANFESLVRVGNKTLWIEVFPQGIKNSLGEILGGLAIVTDITERKKIEETLRFSDAAFKAIKEGVVITRPDYIITGWNESMECITSVQSSEAIGKHILNVVEILDPSPSELKNQYKALEQNDFAGYLSYECLIKTKNETLWIELFPQVIRGQDGEIHGRLFIVMAINERKQSEIRMRESEAMLAEAQRIARLGNWQMDLKSGEVYWSDEMYHLFGYRSGEVSPSADLFFSHVYQDDKHIMDQTLVEDKRKGANIVVRFRRKNGQVWYGNSRSEAICDENGEPIILFGSVQDITEQKEIEIRLRESEASLAEAQRMAKLGSWHLDVVTGELFWSDEMYRLFGYRPGEVSPTKELFLNAVHPDDLELLQDTIALQQIAADGQETTSIIIRLYRKSGELWFANSRTDSVFDASGKLIKQFGSIQDITDIKRAAEKEKQMQQELYNATHLASIGEMASGIAHEINNPLTGVVGFSQLLIDRDIPDDIKEDLEIINHEAQRAAKIVSGLLTFAYQNKPGWSMVNIDEIISNTLELRTHEMELSNIRVVTELEGHLPLTAADGAQLQQVFLNIILNAEQAMKDMKKAGTLTVRTKSTGKSIIITFADTGPGISQENLSRVFNPFFTTKGVGEGTGLGLSMSHGIIKQHKGRINVESEEGHGARFIIELPVTNILDSIDEIDETDDAIPDRDLKKGLVIDDEKPILIYLERLLSGWGYESELVSNAKDAFEMMQENDYDFILLDIKMPDMNGLELYRQLKKVKPEMAKKVLFVTGDVLEKTTSAFLRENDVPSITKPIDVEKLKQSIDKILVADKNM
jgi:PAS domain S-box-containing protein